MAAVSRLEPNPSDETVSAELTRTRLAALAKLRELQERLLTDTSPTVDLDELLDEVRGRGARP